MTQDQWTNVDTYLAGLFLPSDPILDGVLKSAAEAGMPAIHVSPMRGKFLYLLAVVQGSRLILEIGTLAGDSTIWLGRALAAGEVQKGRETFHNQHAVSSEFCALA
jgi:predicted O-methyltransferase YrrM